MKREPVDSEAMRSVGYDRRRHILEIEFERGTVYRYLGVPAPVHDALRDAESLGAYFSEHIRDAGYLVERLDDDGSAGTADRTIDAVPGAAGNAAFAAASLAQETRSTPDEAKRGEDAPAGPPAPGEPWTRPH